MKILLVIPPYVLGVDLNGVEPHKAMLPDGPLGIAGKLRGRGHEVMVLDLVFEKLWQRVVARLEFLPDMLLLSCHTVRNIPCCKAVLNSLVKKWGFRPHTFLGGNSCLHLGIEDFGREGLEVDAVVRGFGHPDDILEAIENRKSGDLKSREATGDIPVPAYDLLPVEVLAKYHQASEGKGPVVAFGIGCAYSDQCGKTYCDAAMDSPWLPRPFTLVAQQLCLLKQLGYRKVWCVDNLLFLDLDATFKFDQLCDELELEWSGMTRVELVCRLPQGFLKQLKRLKEVAMGVEAASATLLQNIARSTTRAKTLEAFQRVNESGIRTNAFVILDLEGSTEQDFIPNLYELLLQIRCTTVSWSFLVLPRLLLTNKITAAEWGFYRYPNGCSRVPPSRVVQQAMLLSGKWWDNWTPNLEDHFFEDEKEFGVNFLEGRIVQEKTARDAAGDIWYSWKKGRRK